MPGCAARSSSSAPKSMLRLRPRRRCPGTPRQGRSVPVLPDRVSLQKLRGGPGCSRQRRVVYELETEGARSALTSGRRSCASNSSIPRGWRDRAPARGVSQRRTRARQDEPDESGAYPLALNLPQQLAANGYTKPLRAMCRGRLPRPPRPGRQRSTPSRRPRSSRPPSALTGGRCISPTAASRELGTRRGASRCPSPGWQISCVRSWTNAGVRGAGGALRRLAGAPG